MIEFFFDRNCRILLVRCQLALTHQNFATFDGLLAKFVAREGTSDTIVDFRGLPPSDLRSPELVARGRRPSRMPGRRRVYVADSDLVFGSLRMYRAYQHRSGATPPMVVRSFEEALSLLDATHAIFEPIILD